MDPPRRKRNVLPDFIVIGAMKSATTTLHEQLARQSDLFLSRPKEPNFFSDDENYVRADNASLTGFRQGIAQLSAA